jgi:hypothetical protein
VRPATRALPHLGNVALAGLVAAKTPTPTASPTFSVANLKDSSETSTSAFKLGHDKYKINTKDSFAAVEILFKKAQSTT